MGGALALVNSFAELTMPDEAALHRFAGVFAPCMRVGDVILLQGDLGAGKTSFARACIQALAGETIEVPSPTFTLVQVYDLPAGPLWHFDLYRVSRPEEIYELGWEDALAEAIAMIEWPDRLGSLRPDNALDIGFTLVGKGRGLSLAGDTAWRRRLERVLP